MEIIFTMPKDKIEFEGDTLSILYWKQGWQFPTKKLFRGRQNRRNNWFVQAEFRLFRGTENSRNSVPNRFAEEKNAHNSVPWNKIRSKRSEFRSEPFRGRDNNSEFRSEACLGRKHAVNSVCWSRIFCKTNFFMPFPFGIDSSVNLGMPRNEHFLPRNNGSCSESIPRNFLWNEFPLPTLIRS